MEAMTSAVDGALRPPGGVVADHELAVVVDPARRARRAAGPAAGRRCRARGRSSSISLAIRSTISRRWTTDDDIADGHEVFDLEG